MCGHGGLDYSWSDLRAFLNLVDEPAADEPKGLNLAPSLFYRCGPHTPIPER